MGSQLRDSNRVRRRRSSERRRTLRAGQRESAARHVLLEIRGNLATAMACAYVASVALKSQRADSDDDAATSLRRGAAY